MHNFIEKKIISVVTGSGILEQAIKNYFETVAAPSIAKLLDISFNEKVPHLLCKVIEDAKLLEDIQEKIARDFDVDSLREEIVGDIDTDSLRDEIAEDIKSDLQSYVEAKVPSWLTSTLSKELFLIAKNLEKAR